MARYRERRADAVVNVPDGPRAPDKWIPMKADHPLDKMRIGKRQGLGADPAVAGRRYQAGMLWFSDYVTATGQDGMVGPIGERVDSQVKPGAAQLRRIAAVERRNRVIRAARLTERRQVILDRVCGATMSMSETARELRLNPSTVREHLFAALDALCSAYSIEELTAVPVLRIEEPSRSKRRK